MEQPNEGAKQVEGNQTREITQIRPPSANFVEVSLGDTETTAAPTAPTKESLEELSTDVTDAPTIPVRRRKSIELQRVETNPQPEVSDSKDISSKPERQSYPKPEVIYAPERLSNLMGCIKFALIAITSVLVLFGVVIVAVAATVKTDRDFLNLRNGLDLDQFSSAANIAIVVGVVIFLIGVIGLCGAIRESACLLIGYFIIALILVILEAAAIGLVWSATNNDEARDQLSKLLWKGIDGLEQHIQTVDIVQEKFHCCGVTGIEDYHKKSMTVPRSCRDASTGIENTEGCLDKLLNYLKDKAAMIGGVTIAVLLLQVGGLALAFLLCCAIRQGSSKLF